MLTPSFGPKPPIGNSLAIFVSAILNILITYFGTKKCYITNKAADSSDFIERFAVLYIPMTCKFAVATLPILIAAVAILAYSVPPDKELHQRIFSYFMHAMAPIGSFIFYVFLNRSFKRLELLIKGDAAIPNQKDAPA